MSTIERKEYQETQIYRTRSPVRNIRSSNQNLSEFDNNLDNLLEDLQNSVSRPGSSLGNHHKETIRSYDSGKTNSLNRVTNVKSSNPVTEYSSDDAYSYLSPDGKKKVEGYKKESYSYKTTNGFSNDHSRNELDNLLDDLQQVKNSSYLEKDTYNEFTSTPDIKNHESKKVVQRELHYGDTPKSTTRDYHYEGTYGDIRQLRPTSPASSSRTSTLSKQAKVTNLHSYPLAVVETTTPDINPEILAQLDPTLHPPGNTKVTTTIKTYTYEIPGSGPYPTHLETDNEQHRDVSIINESQTTPSKSFTYNKYDKYSENVKEETLEPYQRPAPPIGAQSHVKETVTTRNYQPGYSPEPARKHTYVYNETVTTRNVSPPPPVRKEYYIEEKHSTLSNNYHDVPRGDKEVHYHKEVHDSRNQVYPNGYPGGKETIVYKQESHSNTLPKEPVNIEYKYKSESRTTNNYTTTYPLSNEHEPLLPKPFPTDNAGPPKKLDELMATIGNEPPNSPYNAGFTAHEIEIAQRKKIEVMKQQQEVKEEEMQKKEQPLQKTKNVSGPPVYYPPGHEMFARKEENGGWRAQGAYERAAGKYEYEAESKSETKTKRKAAVVPICLPLCCGLPCTIL